MDDDTNLQAAADDMYGVYLPLGRRQPIVVVPLCMRPSLEVEKRYGPCGYIGMIAPDAAELSRWSMQCAAGSPPMELLVTGEEDILSVRHRVSNGATLEDILLAPQG